MNNLTFGSKLSKFSLIKQMISAIRQPQNLGDIPVLKAALLNLTCNRKVDTKGLVLDGSDIDLSELLLLKHETFGFQYANFLLANGLSPFRTSSELRPIAKRYEYVCRQSIAHDFLHVILGFDTRYSGEIGVCAFLVAQKYTRWQFFLLLAALVIYPLLAPSECLQIFKNAYRGFVLGWRAEFALEFPFEYCWRAPAEDVRRALLNK